jgi:perosamine synthetase
MKIVSFPPGFVDTYLEEVRALMENGQVAEGTYFKDAGSYVPGRRSVTVSSGGAAIFALLAYQQHVKRRRTAIVQANTMRALYTVPTLLGMRVAVAESSYADYLAMSPASLERRLANAEVRRDAVVVYSVIGGYLSRSFADIVDLCQRAEVPLIVDAAHGHYLGALAESASAHLAYSFYATKILPAGEGGLVSTRDADMFDWVRRFLVYDRFHNELNVGLNLRASEMSSALIHRLMTDRSVVAHFRDARVALARRYAALCEEHEVRYLDPRGAADYNGYKLVVLDPRDEVARKGTELTTHPPTSGVFDTDVLGQPTTLPHWCPPTYPSLASPATAATGSR